MKYKLIIQVCMFNILEIFQHFYVPDISVHKMYLLLSILIALQKQNDKNQDFEDYEVSLCRNKI